MRRSWMILLLCASLTGCRWGSASLRVEYRVAPDAVVSAAWQSAWVPSELHEGR